MNTLFFLLDTVFSIYLMVVLLRFWLQWTKADFYNPLSQFCVKLTHPILTPLRRVIPGFRGIDFASLLLAYVVAVLKFVTFMSLGILKINVTGLLLLSFLVVLKQAGSLLFWVLIARAILSYKSGSQFGGICPLSADRATTQPDPSLPAIIRRTGSVGAGTVPDPAGY